MTNVLWLVVSFSFQVHLLKCLVNGYEAYVVNQRLEVINNHKYLHHCSQNMWTNDKDILLFTDICTTVHNHKYVVNQRLEVTNNHKHLHHYFWHSRAPSDLDRSYYRQFNGWRLKSSSLDNVHCTNWLTAVAVLSVILIPISSRRCSRGRREYRIGQRRRFIRGIVSGQRWCKAILWNLIPI